MQRFFDEDISDDNDEAIKGYAIAHQTQIQASFAIEILKLDGSSTFDELVNLKKKAIQFLDMFLD